KHILMFLPETRMSQTRPQTRPLPSLPPIQRCNAILGVINIPIEPLTAWTDGLRFCHQRFNCRKTSLCGDREYKIGKLSESCISIEAAADFFRQGYKFPATFFSFVCLHENLQTNISTPFQE